MKLYRNTVEAVVEALGDIFIRDQYASYVVPKLLKTNKKWGSKDRRFLSSTVYNITRYWRLHQYSSNVESVEVNEDIWPIVASYFIQEDIELPEWIEFSTIDKNEIIQRQNKASDIFVLTESIPDWLHEYGEQELGEDWLKEVHALNQEAEVVLRVNPLAIPKAERKNPLPFVINALSKDQIEASQIENYPDALLLSKRRSILHSKVYQQGWVEIQDANSQLVAPFCQPKEEQLIVDTCAGAGGKTLHLAALVQNEADIFALDVAPNKLEELESRLIRNLVTCVESGLVIDFPQDEFKGKADIVLIDAPCSGIGTMKREADKKWKLTPEFIEEIAQLQQQLLQQYSDLVKVDGHLIYSTCSIFPQENQEQIKQFIQSEKGQQFSLEEEQTAYAYKTGYDGFYMARLKRQS